MIDTTLGTSTANSYVSVEDADSYLASVGASTWTGTDEAKEAALIRATQYIDGKFRGSWNGRKLNGRSQALDWPRYGATDCDGNSIDQTIPVEIVKATCEAALRELTSPFSLSPDVVEGTQKTLVGVDSLRWETNTTKTGADAMRPVLTVVEDILSGLICSGLSNQTSSTHFIMRA